MVEKLPLCSMTIEGDYSITPQLVLEQSIFSLYNFLFKGKGVIMSLIQIQGNEGISVNSCSDSFCFKLNPFHSVYSATQPEN